MKKCLLKKISSFSLGEWFSRCVGVCVCVGVWAYESVFFIFQQTDIVSGILLLIFCFFFIFFQCFHLKIIYNFTWIWLDLFSFQPFLIWHFHIQTSPATTGLVMFQHYFLFIFNSIPFGTNTVYFVYMKVDQLWSAGHTPHTYTHTRTLNIIKSTTYGPALLCPYDCWHFFSEMGPAIFLYWF